MSAERPRPWHNATPLPGFKPEWIGQFDTFDDWVNHAARALTGLKGNIGEEIKAICVDTLGRRCHIGGDFMRARDEGTFPVRYFIGGMVAASVIDEVAAERKRHVEVEGFTPERDDRYVRGELAGAAACYVMHGLNISADVLSRGVRAMVLDLWPWSRKWWKPKDRRRDLVRAAALIVAEIERLDRLDDVDRCLACDKPFEADDMVLPDESGDFIHTACCGPEREGYTLNGEVLGPDDPIPTGFRWGDRTLEEQA